MDESQINEEFRSPHVVDVGEAQVCYRTAGNGPALVLLHGFPLSGLTWRKMVPALGQLFTCYALDLIGLGDSTSPHAEDFSSEGQGRVLHGALRALGVSSYALLGNDTGGWIARELALLDGERVTRLVLTNTEIPGHRPPWVPLYQLLAGLPGSSLVFQLMLASRLLQRSSMGFGGCFANLDLIDGEFTQLFLAPIAASSARLDGVLRFLVNMKFARLDRFRELHGMLQMPVGFVWGGDDPTFPEARARAMTAQFPNTIGFRSVPHGKLLVQEEQPHVVATYVTQLLTGAA